MTDECCGVAEAGCAFCELPSTTVVRQVKVAAPCPSCGQAGKPVGRQTVKALLAKSLRLIDGEYFFCRNQDCDIVYFSAGGGMNFSTRDLRERVYQKMPSDPDASICYCFRHRLGDLTDGSAEDRRRILEDITAGIKAAQCACDIRNPQGSCCLGNVRSVLRSFEAAGATTV